MNHEYATNQSKLFDGKHAVLVTSVAAMHVQIKRHKKTPEGEWLIVVETKPFAQETNGKKRSAAKDKPADPAQRMLEGGS